MSLADKSIKNVKALPESKQIEILDFIELNSERIPRCLRLGASMKKLRTVNR